MIAEIYETRRVDARLWHRVRFCVVQIASRLTSTEGEVDTVQYLYSESNLSNPRVLQRRQELLEAPVCNIIIIMITSLTYS